MKPAARPSEPPRRKPIRLAPDAYYKPAAWYFVTICCRNKQPLLEAPDRRDLVQQVLRDAAQRNRVELVAYMILPNHVHLICSAGRTGLPGFIREFKSRTAVEINRRFHERSPWQFRYFDHKLRGQESLQQKCHYVSMNPVRRGLASKPEDYPWSGSSLSG